MWPADDGEQAVALAMEGNRPRPDSVAPAASAFGCCGWLLLLLLLDFLPHSLIAFRSQVQTPLRYTQLGSGPVPGPPVKVTHSAPP